MEWTHNTYYGDASGGKHTQFPTLRRVGVAVVQVKRDGELNVGAHFNLPGNIQTVGRGELYTIHFLVNRLQLGTIALFVTDNKSVFDTYIKGRMAAMSSNNCDLWSDIYNLINSKHFQITVRWMPSHLRELHEKGQTAKWIA